MKKKWQDGGTENRGELQLSQEQAVNLKQCRNRAYSKVELAKDSHVIKDVNRHKMIKVLSNTIPLGVPKEAIALECLALPILVKGVAGGLPNLNSHWYDTQVKRPFKISKG